MTKKMLALFVETIRNDVPYQDNKEMCIECVAAVIAKEQGWGAESTHQHVIAQLIRKAVNAGQ